MSGDPLARLGALRHPDGRTLRLERLWPEGDGRLTLDLRDPAGRTIGGTVPADADAAAALDAREARVARRVGRSPVRVAVGGGEAVRLHEHGVDGRLPALAGLLATPGARLLAHRPGRRAVVRLGGAGGEPPTWAKVERRGRAAGLARGLRTAAAHLPLRVPTVCEERPDDVLLLSDLSGPTLHDLLRAGRTGPAGALAAAARGIAVAADAAHVHDAAAEVAVLEERVARLDPLRPDVAASARALLPGVAAGLLADGGPLLLAHRDLHDKQLVDGGDGRAGVLDLDTLARAEPELDAANLLVHLSLRVVQGICPVEVARATATAVRDAPGPPLRTERLRAYGAATALRLACVYALRPRWSALADVLLGWARTGPPGLDGRRRARVA